MSDANYAVLLFPQALEALGEAIKPYLSNGPLGPHIQCNEIDTAGTFVEMRFQGTSEGQSVTLELMLPAQMIRMIASMRGESEIGFRHPESVVSVAATPPVPVVAAAVAPTAPQVPAASPVTKSPTAKP